MTALIRGSRSVGVVDGGTDDRLTVDEWNALGRSLRLTARERDIVQGIFRRESEGEIARSLDISVNTVHTHLGRIFRKLEVRSTTGLVLRVFESYVRLARSGSTGEPAESAVAAELGR